MFIGVVHPFRKLSNIYVTSSQHDQKYSQIGSKVSGVEDLNCKNPLGFKQLPLKAAMMRVEEWNSYDFIKF